MKGSLKNLALTFSVLALLAVSAAAQTKTLYFLPPNDPEWTLGTPYIAYMNGNTLERRELEYSTDGNRCGWYKATFSGTVPSGAAWIWLNNPPKDQFGNLGADEDPTDWGEDEMPEPFNLAERFGTSNNLFFVPKNGAAGWTATDPGGDGVCTYNFAAIIYDTDWTVNGSFQCGRYEAQYSSNQNSACYSLSPNANGGTTPSGYGINKGIVQSTLGADGKMQFASGATQYDGWTSQNFIDAFKPTPGKNIVQCYDMPFRRNSQGLWEFNSNKLCGDGSMDLDGTCAGKGGYMGGFFPPELDNTNPADYTGCPTCNTKRFAEAFAPLCARNANNQLPNECNGRTEISEFCYNRGRKGTATGNISSCGAEFAQGELGDGNTPEIWHWEGRPNFSGTTSNTADKNQFFCFESTPATFYYKPGQEFFFSGDDDIWVFINNTLAIDLGGTHLAAPGYVNMDARLNDFNLTAAQKAGTDSIPMNIFFCDRRTTMSNVRITTNMYFAQSNALKSVGITGTPEGAHICINENGSDGSCAAVMSGNVGGGEKCGAAMGNIMTYYMLNRKGERIELNTSNPNCVPSGGALVCYGGVTLNMFPTVSSVRGDNKKLVGLLGTHRIWAEVKESEKSNYPGAEPIYMGQVVGAAAGNIVWGKIYNEDNGALIFDLGPKVKNVVSGKLVPIGFSFGAWRCENPSDDNDGCGYDVLVEHSSQGGAVGQQVNGIGNVLTSPGGANSGLKFFKDAEGLEEVNPNGSFEIPSTGLLVLWVMGEYNAADDQEHTISNELKVNVSLPRLRFINPSTATGTPVPVPNGEKKGSDVSKAPPWNARNMEVYLGTPLERAVAAYDVSGGGATGVLCETCNFRALINAWATDNNGGRLDDNPNFGTGSDIIVSVPGSISITNGVAKFDISGVVPVTADTFAFFTINGPSGNPNTLDKWDSLLFKQPPVPYPIKAQIFDSKGGDGIGDSLRVTYSRKFPYLDGSTTIYDTLPNMLVVNWGQASETDTLLFGLGQLNGSKQYVLPNGTTAQQNHEYWNNTERLAYKTKIEEDQEGNSVLVIYGKNFTEDVKTYVYDDGPNRERAQVFNWTTFIDPEQGSLPINQFFTRAIEDKIPPIVVKGVYFPDTTTKNCGTSGNKCRDKVQITASEPVRAVEGLSDEVAKAPFAYWLGSRGSKPNTFNGEFYDAYTTPKDLPDRMQWKPSLVTVTAPDTSKKDSLVEFTYLRYGTNSDQDRSNTPVASDSVRFVWKEKFGSHVLTDLEGNEPNPIEQGRLIEGVRQSEVSNIPIASIDPEKDILGDKLERLKDSLGLFGNKNPRDLFKDRQVAFLPSLNNESWTIDDIKKNYPGSVGQLFTISVGDVLNNLPDGSTYKVEDIVFYAQSYYYTNLGTFVVESQPTEIKCTDEIFKVNGEGDCITNNMSVYLAWNLKDAKNRWVGAGAYVEKYTFYWTFKYTQNPGGAKEEVRDKNSDKIEMLGVRRIKTKK